MVVYTEISIPATGFPIGKAFAELPDVLVEMEQIVPIPNAIIPFIWVEGARPDDVVQATYSHEAAEDIMALNEVDGRTLYRVVWKPGFRDTVVSISESGLSLLSGIGTSEEWRFEFRSETKTPLSEFVTELRDADVPFTLVRLTDNRPARNRNSHDLSSKQFEALHLAYTEGYFEEPRAVTLDTLATRLGITRQAFAGRLRRAFDTLISQELYPHAAQEFNGDAVQ